MAVEDREDLRKQVLRWSLIFAALLAAVFFALWWSASAVHFGATRVDQSTPFTWRVTGVVRDAETGRPVPWASLRDDPSGRPPHAAATASYEGVFDLHTIAEPHSVVVSAFGYQPRQVSVGRAWYVWMPKGSERLTIELQREPRP